MFTFANTKIVLAFLPSYAPADNIHNPVVIIRGFTCCGNVAKIKHGLLIKTFTAAMLTVIKMIFFYVTNCNTTEFSAIQEDKSLH